MNRKHRVFSPADIARNFFIWLDHFNWQSVDLPGDIEFGELGVKGLLVGLHFDSQHLVDVADLLYLGL